MKITKENVCVYINDEAQLIEARIMLEKYGENIDFWTFRISKYLEEYNYLSFLCDWGLGMSNKKTIITLSQLEKILKS